MPISIRLAQADDAETVWALTRELAMFEELDNAFVATEEDFRREISKPNSVLTVLLAEVDGAIAAYAVCYLTFSTFSCRRGLWLEDLYVRPEFRRQGIARALMDDMASRSEGRFEWEVLNWNENAIALYEAYGARSQVGWTKYRLTPHTA
jgi:ribosomal protein S18 acetylase RimI-like enzyme